MGPIVTRHATDTVDELIGSAYPIVKLVAKNMAHVRRVSEHSAEVDGVFANITYISGVYNNIATIASLAVSIDGIIGITEHFDDIMEISDNLPAILSAAGDATAAALLAQKWATETFNVPVEPGMYSAKHWSISSQNSADASASSAVTAANHAVAASLDATAADIARIAAQLAEANILAHTFVVADITDMSANGRSLVTAADYSAMKTLLAITLANITDASANGRSLVSAANYAAMKTLLTIAVADITDASANGRSFISAANYAAMKTLLTLVKADVGLGNVDNTSDLNKPISTAEQTALNLKANLASPTFTGTVAGITKTMVGLSNVDNTADTAKPVSTAQQTALDLKLDDSQLDTDGTLAANSDTKIASQKAVKTYVDALIAAADAMVFKGVINASANPNYPLANAGWTYRISVAGKIGGASGPNVQAGDILICITDGTAAGDHATVGANWGIVQNNIDGALITTDIGVTVQAYSAILGAIAALTGAVNDDIIQRKAGVFTNRTMAQLKTDLVLVKADVGLGNVDNTSDVNKPVSTAQQTALNLKLNLTGGTLSGALNFAPTVTVASATSTAIGAAAANAIDISGIVTITSFDNVAAGIERSVRFTGALLLTHNAASFILPGAANITTVAGDTAHFRSLGGGSWICLDYTRGTGVNLIGDPLKANLASPTFTGTVAGITKSMVGLGNVDNTSDLNKPISTAEQTALNLKLDITTAASTYQPLDASLTAHAALVTAANKAVYYTAADTPVTYDLTVFARSLLDDAAATNVLTTLGVSAFIQTFLDDIDALTARATLGLTIGTNVQAYDADLTTWAGLTPTANAQSLVTAADYSAMRTLLSLVPGTNVQAYDAELAALAGLVSAVDSAPYFTGSGTAALMTVTAAARSVLDDITVGAMLTTLGGQPLDATLTAVAGVTTAANKAIYWTAVDVAATYDLTAFARTLLDDADALTMRATLGLTIGTNVQAYDADLTTWAGLTPSVNAQSLVTAADYAAMKTLLGLTVGTNVQAYDADLAAIAALISAVDSVPYFTGSGTAALMTVTAAARTVLDDVSVGAMLTTLGGQPLDAELTAIAGLVSAADAFPYFTGSGTAALATITAAARTVLDDVSVGAMLTTLGGQPLDAELTAIAGLTSAADSAPYFTGVGAAALMTVTAAARSVLDDVSVGAMLTTLGGQPLDSELTAIAGLTSAADAAPYFTGVGTAAVMTVTAAARTVLDDTTVGAMLTTLGGQPLDASLTAHAALVTAANKAVYYTGADVPVTYDISAYGRTLANLLDAAAGRTSLGLVINTDVQAYDADLALLASPTAWRLFYSNGASGITELALGANGTFLQSNGPAVAPTFATPAGSGDVSKVGTPVNDQIGVWTGSGTLEGDASLTFDTVTDTLAIAASGKFSFGAVNILSDAAGVTTLANIDAIDATTETTLEAALELDSLQGNLSVSHLNGGTGASSGTYWRGDGTWVTPAGSGDVSKVGTPVDNQIGVWTGSGTLEGDASLTFDTTTDTLAVAASGKFAFGAVNILDDAAGVTTLSNIDTLDATTESTIEAAIDTLANLISVQGLTVTLADAGFDALFGWDDSANAYINLSAADARTLLGLIIGTNVQAYDADLTTWAGLTPSANAQSLVTAADYSAMRTLLGLVIGTNVQAYDADLTTWAGLTPSANAQSFVTAADYAAMKTLLSLNNVNNTSDATLLDDIAGRIRGRNRQVGTTYTFVLTDAGKLVEGNNASAQTYTVPPNSSVAFPVDKTVINIGQYGAGTISIAAGAGVTIRSAGSKLKLNVQYSTASLVKIGTDEWWLFGDIKV